MDVTSQIAGIAALAEPVRRDLYAFVSTQTHGVGREAAANAIGVPVHTAKFHLDRMVEGGLLEVEYRRPSGKSGPGAGRPTKMYRRAAREFAVSLPERRYDLAGHILAQAVERAAAGATMKDALRESAHAEGRRVGAAYGNPGRDLDRLAEALASQGYEPRREGDGLTLANCPFDSLAQEHTDVVCGLNESYIQGLADGLGCTTISARLEPTPGQCCVKASPSDAA